MIYMIAISAALLVIVAGMFLLAKTKKEELGNMFTFVSYATVTVGGVLLLGSLCFGVCKMACTSSYKQCSVSKAGCHGQGYGQKSCYIWNKGRCGVSSGCSSSASGCSASAGCKKPGACGKASGCSKSTKCAKSASCAKSSKCSADGKCTKSCCSKKVIKKVIKDRGDKGETTGGN